jgi:uncharacterized membrane protein YfbV (UPF0208 family)
MVPFLRPYQALCILARLLVAFAAFCVSNGVLVARNHRAAVIMAAVLLIPALVMLALWALGARGRAFESLDPSGRTWWNSLRPVHAALIATFSALTLLSPMPQHAYAALVADAGVGLGAFVTRNAEK